jgi:hypothetical protein
MTPVKETPALKSALKPKEKRRKFDVPKPIKPASKPIKPASKPINPVPKPHITFANTVGQPLTKVREINRIGRTSAVKPPRRYKPNAVSITTYRRMLQKRNKYKYQFGLLQNELNGKARTTWCGLGKCIPPRPAPVVQRNIREVKNAMNGLNSAIAQQKKLLVEYAKRYS